MCTHRVGLINKFAYGHLAVTLRTEQFKKRCLAGRRAKRLAWGLPPYPLAGPKLVLCSLANQSTFSVACKALERSFSKCRMMTALPPSPN
ncbi:MAG: hypothetical protein [Circular genetic element sp.]|nr:MAG: hypothetical protein [Circular genetic element sp.]AXQ65364.1 MAG: hypothetical protein [Circular genetic element sp.]